MEERRDTIASSLSLEAIGHAAIAYATFGMTTDEQAYFWHHVRKGTTKQLLEQDFSLTSTQPIEMILGALTVVDGTAADGAQQSAETRQLNSDMVCAIMSRKDEILKMPLSTTSMLFACLSRFIALMDQGQEEPVEASTAFDVFKESFAQSLAASHELKIDDVFILATALAAE